MHWAGLGYATGRFAWLGVRSLSFPFFSAGLVEYIVLGERQKRLYGRWMGSAYGRRAFTNFTMIDD